MRDELAAQFGDSYDQLPLAAKRFFVIHHWGAEPPEGKTPRELSYMTAAYHVSKGWPGHGYQLEVAPDGTICWTGDLDSARASVWGRNHEVISAVMVGNMSLHRPTDAQLSSLRWLRVQSGLIPTSLVNVGHLEIALPESPTSCPGATWPEWRSLIFPDAN